VENVTGKQIDYGHRKLPAAKELNMKNSNQRIRFLNNYRRHLQLELDQMDDGRVSPVATEEVSATSDDAVGALAIVAVMLIFAGVFLA
jgi:hypothetical protein